MNFKRFVNYSSEHERITKFQLNQTYRNSFINELDLVMQFVGRKTNFHNLTIKIV